MATDIYGYERDGSPKAVFTSDRAVMTFESKGKGYMIQDWQVAYRQDVQEVFELGSGNIYWVRGRPTGQGQIQRIIGTEGFTKFLPPEAFDVCKGGAGASISASSGACFGGSDKPVAISLKGVLVTNIGFQSSVQDNALVRGGIEFKFAVLDAR